MRHCRFIGKRVRNHQIATRGHDLEYRGTEEVLVVETVYNPEPSSGLGPTELPCSRTKATRKTIEPGIPENCPVELSFWTRQSNMGIISG